MPDDLYPQLSAVVAEVSKLGISFTVRHAGGDGATKTWQVSSEEKLDLAGTRNFERLIKINKMDGVSVAIVHGHLSIKGRK